MSLNRNENVEITMVSDENFFLFSPLLHEVATGGIETRHIAYPIRRLQRRDRFNFIRASVKNINLVDRKVLTSIGTMDFDYLVLALGSITDMSDLDSTGTTVFTLKTLNDARRIKNHVIGVFERASVEKDQEKQRQLLTFVVSGGGEMGVQFVTALRDFVFTHLTKLYKTIDPNNIRFVLVEAESKIISQLHTKLGAYVMKQLRQMGIEVRLRSRVTCVRRNHVEINNSKNMPTNTVIWVAGVTTNPRIAQLNVRKDKIGRPLVNDYLEVPGFPGIYAVGDCAHFKDPRTKQPIPPKAHTGVRQAKVAAHNVLADIRRGDKRPYLYSNPFEIVSLGSSKAVFGYGSLRVYGFLARFIWMAGYSLLITGTYNRIRIMMDWLLSLVFGRDTTFLE
jgi:NADH dehydrogenase